MLARGAHLEQAERGVGVQRGRHRVEPWVVEQHERLPVLTGQEKLTPESLIQTGPRGATDRSLSGESTRCNGERNAPRVSSET